LLRQNGPLPWCERAGDAGRGVGPDRGSARVPHWREGGADGGARMTARANPMIYLKTAQEIAKLREVNLLVCETLAQLEASCKAGVSTWELNEVAGRKLKQLGGESAFLGYHGYPAVLCTSVNEVVVHGIPRKDVVLKDGDVIGIDFGAFKGGYC